MCRPEIAAAFATLVRFLQPDIPHKKQAGGMERSFVFDSNFENPVLHMIVSFIISRVNIPQLGPPV